MTKLRVNLSRKDIQQGIQGDTWCCPIALCINRNIGRRVRVMATYFFLCDVQLGEFQNIELPDKAIQFIRKFDKSKTKKMKPISFDVPIPDNFKDDKH